MPKKRVKIEEAEQIDREAQSQPDHEAKSIEQVGTELKLDININGLPSPKRYVEELRDNVLIWYARSRSDVLWYMKEYLPHIPWESLKLTVTPVRTLNGVIVNSYFNFIYHSRRYHGLIIPLGFYKPMLVHETFLYDGKLTLDDLVKTFYTYQDTEVRDMMMGLLFKADEVWFVAYNLKPKSVAVVIPKLEYADVLGVRKTRKVMVDLRPFQSSPTHATIKQFDGTVFHLGDSDIVHAVVDYPANAVVYQALSKMVRESKQVTMTVVTKLPIGIKR